MPAEIIASANVERLSEIAGRLFASLLATWSQAFNDALRTVWDLPIKDTVLLLGAGAVFGLIFRAVDGEAEPGVPVRRELWLAQYFKSLQHRNRQNLAFIAILAVAGYLSIAAIAAIPALTESAAPGAEVSAEKLKQRLEALREESDRGLKELASPPDPLAELQRLANEAKKTQTPNSTPAPSTPPVMISPRDLIALENFLRDVTAARNDRLKAHADLVDWLKKQNNDEAIWAAEEYQANTVERKGLREAVRYYYDVIKWYRLSIRKRQSQSQWSAREVERFEAETKRFAVELGDSLKATLPEGAGTPDRIADRISFALNTGFLTARLQEPPSGQDDVVPVRAQLGSYLGPFRLVASWLLRTESLSLALIVGMLGFGLLGSASSSFIREKGRNLGPDQPLVHDLSGIIIRGCSAAVVVFLAAKGGLAIFGSGAAEPNPYVLLLTCLVAAVFSDAVWERAQTWFKNLGEKRSRADSETGKKRSPGAPGKHLAS